ncbi:MAG: VWA domain-containing protein [Alphaproteobacteria bacterium]|nr:VWA domain-containing protein [Alphaproteobacteria bacterium]
MIEALLNFHFLRPLWLLGLLWPAYLLFRYAKDDRTQSSWANVCDENLLQYLLIRGNYTQRRLSYNLAVAVITLIVLAMAGPTWEKKHNPALSADNPLMILLNVSSDMGVKDVLPSRGERAKYVIKDLLAELKTSESGLLVYSREPFVVTPFTDDPRLIDNLLPAINADIMPINGDRLDRAIELALERMKAVGYDKGNLVVLTADAGERFDAALSAAARAHSAGFDVNIIKINENANDKLEMIAAKGDGIYLNYNQNIKPLADKINAIHQKNLQQSENMQAVWLDFGYYLFWVPAVLLLYYFRRGIFLLIIVFMLAQTRIVQAHPFQNKNQEAMHDFKNGDFAAAAEKFTDSAWRGAAAYKNGQYEQAVKIFAQQKDVDGLYNQGNALAKAGHIREAMAKYEEVLKLDAHHEDARFNLDYLKKQQQNQDQQQQDQKQDQNQGQDQDQQDQDQQQQDQKQDQKQDQQNQDQQQQDQKQDQGQDQQQQDQKQDQNQDQQQQDQKQDQNQDQQQQDQQQQDQQQDQKQDQNQDQQQQDQKQEQNQGQDQDQKQDQGLDQQQDQQQQEQEQREGSYGTDREGAEEMKASAVTGGDARDEKEKMRAKMQQYREIPEDQGGLLRAFIRKEYEKNRYEE